MSDVTWILKRSYKKIQYFELWSWNIITYQEKSDGIIKAELGKDIMTAFFCWIRTEKMYAYIRVNYKEDKN